MKKILISLAAVSTLSLGAAALAAPSMGHGGMAGMDMGKGSHMQMAMGDFHAAEMKMHKAMMAAKGTTTDVTYARKMIAHHQGAIDMARVELQHGTDADAKQLAQMTIDENTKGIADLQAWLHAHGG